MTVEAKLLTNQKHAEEETEAHKLLKLSVSKSKTFEDCKAKYRFAYIEKLPRIDRDFHIFGKYLHQILENFHGDLIAEPDKRDNWEPHLKTAHAAAFEEYKAQLTLPQVTEAEEIIGEYRAILIEEGVPDVIAVEKPFWVSLDNRVLLNGFIDRVQIDSDDVLHVMDYKTTKDKKYLSDFFQLLTYAYTLMLENEEIKRVRASFICLRHGFDFITREYTRDEVMNVAEKFIKYANSIESEQAWRPNPQFLCKYCDYLDHCSSGHSYLVKRGVLKNEAPIVGLTKW